MIIACVPLSHATTCQCVQCSVTMSILSHLLGFSSQDTHHHPVFRMHNMHRASGLSLNGLMDDATGHAIDQNDPDEASLLMQVCALRHHSQQIGVQVL